MITHKLFGSSPARPAQRSAGTAGIPQARRTLAVALFGLGLVSVSSALEVPYDFNVPCTPENAIFGHYSSTKKPVITIKSGAVVRIEGGGGNKWKDSDDPDVWLKQNGVPITVETNTALKEIVTAIKESPNRLPPPADKPNSKVGGHFIIGPIYVEDAEPGDSLEVRILDVTPRLPYGANSASPAGGALPGVMPRPFSKVYMLDLKRNAAVYDKDVEIPLGPFNGVNGTCPPDSEGPNRKSTQPGAFGGNLDSKDLVTGSTLYLPVFQKGALFYTGDCHAAQGDGEIAGDAIGTANTVIYQFILHKGVTLKGPRAETPTHYIVYGLDPDLDKAMNLAMLGTLDFLKEKQGYDLMQAYTLCSAAVDFRVTQVVDKTLGIHSMIPKKLFVNDKDTYWYRTPRF
ncbi:MAG: acetamidase/formamidase family protein [Verrucomicrobia bacterium]|nr:acetamidase/formamidase family protein [Verrucomicrobiota bacterium]